MWRGFLVGGINIAAFGGAVILAVLAIGAACSGGTSCGPASGGMNVVFTSVGVLILGAGFLIVVVGLGLRPGGRILSRPSSTSEPSFSALGRGQPLTAPSPPAPTESFLPPPPPPSAPSAGPLPAAPPAPLGIGPSVVCMTCGRPATFVADQGRAFCPNCGRWV
jgi:hypothetical protein